MFFLPNQIFLIKTLLIGFAATLWLRGTTHTESHDMLVNGFGLFWNLLLIKSLIANSTPLMWLHFPFPRRSRPEGYIHAALNTSHFLRRRTERISAFRYMFLSTQCGDIFMWKQRGNHKAE